MADGGDSDRLRWVADRRQNAGRVTDDSERTDETRQSEDHRRTDGGEPATSPELSEQLVEDSTAITAVIGTDSRITFVNSTVERVLGYDPDELLGERLSQYAHGDDSTDVSDAVEALQNGESDTETTDVRVRHADGSPRWLRTTFRDRLDSDVVDGIVVSAQDVTERVEREELLRSRNEQLAEFAQVVSHDLRNPLNVAQARVRLLDEAFDSEHVPPIVRALDRMENIVEDTLVLAKQGQRVSETEPVVVGDLADDCWESVVTEAGTLDVIDEFRLCGDPSRLRHVFENLFRNAVEHATDATDTTVRVGRLDPFYTSTREAERPRGFYVEDDGPGIPESERDDVFDPGHTSAKDGTGFGLTIVKRIADAHGWSVRALNSPSGGARFEFTGVEFPDE